MTKAVLALADGKIFVGKSFGAEVDASNPVIGEVVFNTSMTGYQEILSDPSYAGQIMTFTSVEIGNVGCNELDWESDKLHVMGLVVRNASAVYSNYRADDSLNNYLKKFNIPGVSDVDTRALVQHIRDNGAQMAAIATGEEINVEALVQAAKAEGSMLGKNYVDSVTTESEYTWDELPWDAKQNAYPKVDNQDKPLVVALDFGIKRNILRKLNAIGFRVKVLPAYASSEQILSENPAGVFLSNGPGDPATLRAIVENVKALLGKVPIFGICLGHQVLSQAVGAKTFKLKFGHRGGNHPVMDLRTRKVEITSQNHGFAVDAESFSSQENISHLNLNDQTVEGLELKELKAFSVQYHPEASPGPHDASYLFQEFYDLVSNNA